MTAGLVPLFTSAPRLKLHINDKLVAYAIGFNMSVSVDIQPVQAIGNFGALSLEPTLYNVVTGTIQIIPLTSGTTRTEQLAAIAANPLISTNSQVIADNNGKQVRQDINTVQASTKGDQADLLSLQNLNYHLDPSKVLLSRSFDMDLYMDVPTDASIDALKANQALPAETTAKEIWMRIKFCRLSSRNTNISQGQLLNQPVNFQGLLATPAIDEFALDSLLKESLG